MIDDNDETYWATSDGKKSGEILIDLGKKQSLMLYQLRRQFRTVKELIITK